jgi:hypothetical protein
LEDVLSESNAARSFSESPAGTGPPSLSALVISAGTVAGKLMWMPSRPIFSIETVPFGSRNWQA